MTFCEKERIIQVSEWERDISRFRDCTYLTGPGIYLLYLDDVLQWVGKTDCLARRIGQHHGGYSTEYQGALTSIEFNRVLVLPCELEGLDVVERQLIQQLRPEMNKKDTVGTAAEDYSFIDGPLKGMTIKAKKAKVYDYRTGTDLDEYLEELGGKFL